MDTNYEFLLLLSQCMSFESLFMCILLACLSVTDINVYLQSGQKPTQAAGIATGHCCFPSKQVCKNTKTEYRLSTLISFTEPCQVHVKKGTSTYCLLRPSLPVIRQTLTLKVKKFTTKILVIYENKETISSSPITELLKFFFL